jgi:galactokinase
MTGICSALSAEGAVLPQFDAIVVSDVPIGSGLSSSAALEVATAITLAAMLDEPIEPKKIALLSWRVETQFVGVASGVMDQFASALCVDGNDRTLPFPILPRQIPRPSAARIFPLLSRSALYTWPRKTVAWRDWCGS